MEDNVPELDIAIETVRDFSFIRTSINLGFLEGHKPLNNISPTH